MYDTYIITCDEANYILPINIHMHRKYGKNLNKLYCLGYNKPNYDFDENIEFVSLKNKRENKNNWFIDIYNYLNNIEDEFIIFSVDDLPLINYVSKDALNFVNSYLENNKDTAIFMEQV